MTRYAAGALSLALLVAGLVGLTVRASSPTQTRSYPVICVSHTVPWDPQPYEVCVYDPL